MTRTRWDIFALALFSGVLSGLQVGKAPPALPMMRVDLGLDLVTAGWVTSIYYGVGALCGVVAGLAADTLGPRRLLFAGMVCMGFGSLLGAYAGDGTSLLLTRFLEGLGFVAVTVTAPKIIAAAASPADRNLVFGIWGTYMPIGMAMSLLIAPILLTAWGWQGLWLANAGLIGLFALVCAWGLRPRRWPADFAAGAFDWSAVIATVRRPGPWLFGLCFGIYTLQWIAIMSWLPTFLMETQGLSIGGASAYTALIVFMNVLGNLAAAWLMRRGAARWVLVMTAFLFMAATGAVIFASFTPDWLKIPLAMIFSGVGGLLPASALAGAVAHAPTRRQIAMSGGFVVQGAACGSLFGPPLMAAIVGAFGDWHAAWWTMFVWPTIGLMLIWKLRAADRSIEASA